MKKLTKNAIIFASGALVGAILYKSHMNNLKCDIEEECPVSEPTFETLRDAMKAFSELRDLLSEYGVITESDFYKICEMKDSTNGIGNMYGWTILDTARIDERGDKYTIVMPRKEKLS